jgi:Tfp pilus assembly protein PilO
MSALKSPDVSVLRRPRIMATIGVLLLVLGIWYFAWWSPEGHKLSSVQQQQLSAQQKVNSLQTTLNVIEHERAVVQKYRNFLTFFGSEVPVQPEQGQLVSMLGRLENSDGVQVASIDDSTTSPPASGTALSTVPVSISVTGPHSRVMKFLADLYGLPRLITIQSVQPSPTSGAGNGAYDVLRNDSVPFSLTISGTAYFSGTLPAAG